MGIGASLLLSCPFSNDIVLTVFEAIYRNWRSFVLYRNYQLIISHNVTTDLTAWHALAIAIFKLRKYLRSKN